MNGIDFVDKQSVELPWTMKSRLLALSWIVMVPSESPLNASSSDKCVPRLSQYAANSYASLLCLPQVFLEKTSDFELALVFFRCAYFFSLSLLLPDVIDRRQNYMPLVHYCFEV